jgi:hypothetical protein
MGFNGCWIAVKDRDLDDLAGQIGAEAVSGEPLEDYPDSTCVGGTLKSGWALFIYWAWDDRLMQDQALARLSQGTRLVACQMSETVMVSEAQFWANGARVWRVSHDCQTGDINHLQIEGDRLLKNLDGYRQKAIAEREKDEDVDFMFDVPFYLAREMTGFKHDEQGPKGAEFFEMRLVSNNPQSILGAVKKPWWKFW